MSELSGKGNSFGGVERGRNRDLPGESVRIPRTTRLIQIGLEPHSGIVVNATGSEKPNTSGRNLKKTDATGSLIPQIDQGSPGSSSGKVHRLDLMEDVTSGDTGKMIAASLKSQLERNGIALPQNPHYLALGAGSAKAELAFASRFGVQQTDITLVDRGFSERSKEYFRNSGFEGKLVESDVYNFFTQPGLPKFDLVTAFGMEYVFDSPTRYSELANQLPVVLKDRGIILIFPNVQKGDISRFWEPLGFKSLRRPVVDPNEMDTLLAFQYKPKHM